MSPDQDQLACDALVNLGAIETEQGLHAEGLRAIQGVLHCSVDDARAALRQLRVRGQIEETTSSPSDDLAERAHDPVQHFRWVRPS